MTSADAGGSVLVINPLKRALAHYEDELVETLQACGVDSVQIAHTVSGDWVTGFRQRVAVALRIVRERLSLSRTVRHRTVIVVWPLFGYLEPLTLWWLARHNKVFIVVHDPDALRLHDGLRLARRVFTRLLRMGRMNIVYHTEHAQQVGERDVGVKGVVVPHPVRVVEGPSTVGSAVVDEKPVVRVLGQYKPTRSLTALTSIAEQAGDSCVLEIHGRGWPDVPGWTVENRFVSEPEFITLVETSDCVVIAYESFFQSGVAVRCFEAGVPVVAPENEHIAQLYGHNWPGSVRGSLDWHSALLRALAADSSDIRRRHHKLQTEIVAGWNSILLARDEVGPGLHDKAVER